MPRTCLPLNPPLDFPLENLLPISPLLPSPCLRGGLASHVPPLAICGSWRVSAAVCLRHGRPGHVGCVRQGRWSRRLPPMKYSVCTPQAGTQQEPTIQKKSGATVKLRRFDLGAQERTRTSTVLPPLGPEPSASTNSATWARCET